MSFFLSKINFTLTFEIRSAILYNSYLGFQTFLLCQIRDFLFFVPPENFFKDKFSKEVWLKIVFSLSKVLLEEEKAISKTKIYQTFYIKRLNRMFNWHRTKISTHGSIISFSKWMRKVNNNPKKVRDFKRYIF